MSTEQILATIAFVAVMGFLAFGMRRRSKLGGPQKYARTAKDGDFPDGPNRTRSSPLLWFVPPFMASSQDGDHSADTADSSDSGGGDGGD